MNTDRIVQMEKDILIIKARNKKVEGEKAWETSMFRKLLICLITYVVAGAIMYSIGVERFYLNAIIPVAGYFLSTLSIPVVKRWWIKRKMI